MKLFKNLCILLIVLIISSCGNKNSKNNSLLISGTITGARDKTNIILGYCNNIPINATEIKNGKFEMTFTLDEVPSEVIIYTFVNKIRKEKYFYIDTTDIKVNGDINHFEKLKITGSKYNDDFEVFYEYSKKMGNPYRLYQLISDSNIKMDRKQKLDLYAEIDKIEALNLDLTKSYIRNHPKNYASLIELWHSCNEIKKDSIKVLYSNLAPELKSKRQAKFIYDYITKSESPETGDRYTDFEAKDKTGKKHHISEIKGKYILLDFTRVSCGACCAANADLAILYQKNSKQLAIVSFSTDLEKKDWLDGIKDYKVDWLSLWDGKGLESPVYKKYVDGAMPQFYLINPKGIVVKKWTGYGPGSFERIVKYLQ